MWALASGRRGVRLDGMPIRLLFTCLFASALLVACADDEPEPLTCEEADLEASRLRAELWDDPNACTSDEVCVPHSVDITCEVENNFFGACPVVAHVDSAGALADVNAVVAEQVCPLIRDCDAGPSCIEPEPRCVAFRCAEVQSTPGSCLAACEALGCGDCAARCVAEPVCVTAASSCAEVQACGMGRFVRGQAFDEGTGSLEPSMVIGILEMPPTDVSADLACGIGPDGRMYRVGSGTLRDALGWPACDEPSIFDAPDC